MYQSLSIRDETEADVGAIGEVTAAAFKTLEISRQTEPFTIKALRAVNALTMNKIVPFVLVILITLTGCSGTMPKLGIDNGQLKQCPETPNCVNSQAQDEQHHIHPIRFIGTQQEAQSALLKLLETWKRTRIMVAEENYIRAEFTSMVFRFVDDVEFYLPSTEVGETIIHVRSASRIGYSDFGVNRKRIERIRSRLK